MPKRLAEIVIETGLASRPQVIRAAQRAEAEEMSLIAALVREHGVDELALVAAIKRQIRIPIIDPAAAQHDPDAIRELPRDVCWRLKVMPLATCIDDSGSKTLRLAMADPTDTVAVAEIEHITGAQVEASLMPLSAVEELIDKAYRAYVTEVIPRARLGTVTGPDAVEPVVHSAHDVTAPRVKPPSTVPFHRVSDEASLEVRHRALLGLLVQKGIIGKDEYEEQVRQLMRGQDDEG